MGEPEFYVVAFAHLSGFPQRHFVSTGYKHRNLDQARQDALDGRRGGVILGYWPDGLVAPVEAIHFHVNGELTRTTYTPVLAE